MFSVWTGHERLLSGLQSDAVQRDGGTKRYQGDGGHDRTRWRRWPAGDRVCVCFPLAWWASYNITFTFIHSPDAFIQCHALLVKLSTQYVYVFNSQSFIPVAESILDYSIVYLLKMLWVLHQVLLIWRLRMDDLYCYCFLSDENVNRFVWEGMYANVTWLKQNLR